jgi:hypothetical protein
MLSRTQQLVEKQINMSNLTCFALTFDELLGAIVTLGVLLRLFFAAKLILCSAQSC